MFLYNITLITESDSAKHVNGRIQQFVGNFGSAAGGGSLKFLKMLDSPHEGVTFCLQLNAEDQASIQHFQQNYLQGLQSDLEQDFPGKVLYFESIMEYLA